MRVRSHVLLLALSTTALAALAACSKTETSGSKACCRQPVLPPGTPEFTIVRDDVSGQSDGQTVKIRAVLKQKTKRDAVYPALHILYRFAMKRDSFEPINFSGEIFASDSEAQGGSAWVAKVWREQNDKGPKCDNKIKLELPEQVKSAFEWSTGRGIPEDLEDTCRLTERKKVTRHDDKFAHKASFKVDAPRNAAEVSFPYLDDGGKDEYAKDISFNSAMTFWAEFTTTMFNKADDLKELTYVGVMNDEPVLKITVTRDEFNSKLSNVQETISSYAAITFAKLGLHKTDDKGALKEQEAHKTKTYAAALGFLPKDRVFVSPKLKKAGKG